MKRPIIRWLMRVALLLLLAGLNSCTQPQVYGSIGISSGSGYRGSGPPISTGISMGGRTY